MLKNEPDDPLDEDEELLSNKSSKISPAKPNNEPIILSPENNVEFPSNKSSKISSPSPKRSVIKSPLPEVDPVDDDDLDELVELESPKRASSISSINEPVLVVDDVADDDDVPVELESELPPNKSSNISPSRDPPVDVEVCDVVVVSRA